MKVLILSCNTGEGHNSCAKSIMESFAEKNIICDTVDCLRFISPVISSVMAHGHRFIYRHLPALFDFGYRFTEKHDFLYRKGAPLYAFLSLGAVNLADLINNNGYDTVICAHVFAGVMMTEAESMCNHPVLTSFLATDYTCSPITEVSDLKLYFIPDERLKAQFAAKGISAKKLIPLGIPIRKEFYDVIPKEKAKKVEGIGAYNQHLVIMCGSMGCGPMEKLIQRLSTEISDDIEITVVCGNNQKLYNKLSVRYGACPQIHVRGYVKNVSRLMESADVYLTKPGGISVTEAAVRKTPMVLVNAVGGCELYNYKFFTGNGAAVTGNSIEEITGKCLELLNSPKYCRQICEIYENTIQRNAAQEITAYLIDVYQESVKYMEFQERIPDESQKLQEERVVI